MTVAHVVAGNAVVSRTVQVADEDVLAVEGDAPVVVVQVDGLPLVILEVGLGLEGVPLVVRLEDHLVVLEDDADRSVGSVEREDGVVDRRSLMGDVFELEVEVLPVDLVAEILEQSLALVLVLGIIVDTVAFGLFQLLQDDVRRVRDVLALDDHVPDISLETVAVAVVLAGKHVVQSAVIEDADGEVLAVGRAVDGNPSSAIDDVEMHPFSERVRDAGVEIIVLVVRRDVKGVVLRNQAEGPPGGVQGDDVAPRFRRLFVEHGLEIDGKLEGVAIEVLAEIDLPVSGFLAVLVIGIETVAIYFFRLFQEDGEFRHFLAVNEQVSDMTLEILAAAIVRAGDDLVSETEQFADLERYAVDGDETLIIGDVKMRPGPELVRDAGVEIGAAVVHPDEEVLVFRDQAERPPGGVDGKDVPILRRFFRGPHDVDVHLHFKTVPVEFGFEFVFQKFGALSV